MMTYDPTVDAAIITHQAGEIALTLPLHLDGVALNLDLSSDGRVLSLEVLGASKLFALLGRYGGELVLPERIENREGFSVLELFPGALARA